MVSKNLEHTLSRMTLKSQGTGERSVEVHLDKDGGRWRCLPVSGGCGAVEKHSDHVMTMGAATAHNMTCGADSREPVWCRAPRRAQEITGPHGAEVTITGGRWDCCTCGQGGSGDDPAFLAAVAGIHTVLCGADDSEAAAATLVKGNSTLHRAMSEWVDERVDGGLADLREQLQSSEELRKLAEQTAELAAEEASAANSERKDIIDENRVLEQRLKDVDTASTLVADSDKLRAEVTKPDLKASVLVAAAVGAVVAGGGALGSADLPVAAVGTGAGAVFAAVASVVTLLVAMRPGVSSDPDTLVTSQIRDVDGQIDQARRRVQDPDLEALGRERAGLQRLARRKFALVRYAIDGALGSIGLAVVTAVIIAVTDLVGGA